MKFAICKNENGAWIPVIAFDGDYLVNTVSNATSVQMPDFTVGQSVKINGNLYEGMGEVEKLDGNDVLVRAENGKLYRYNPEDIVNGVITISNTDTFEDDNAASVEDLIENVCDDSKSEDFEISDPVIIDGTIYKGYGRVERFDGDDVLVRAENGKLYRYNLEDIDAGMIKVA
jgi:hypothetical protein